MSETMAFLAENWIVGSAVSVIVLVGIHLAFSIRLLRGARSVGMDIGVSAMIPIVNLALWFKKCYYARKGIRVYGDDEVIEI